MKLGKAVWRKLRALAMRTMPGMISCQELGGFMVDYLEGTLPKGQRRTFDRHLRLCRDCRRYLEAYKRTITLSQAALYDNQIVYNVLVYDVIRYLCRHD